MSILQLTDKDGDPVFVDSDRIVGLEIQAIPFGPNDEPWRCTAIRTLGGTLWVAESIGVVYERWISARGERVAPKAPSPAQASAGDGFVWMHPALPADRPAVDRKGDPLP